MKSISSAALAGSPEPCGFPVQAFRHQNLLGKNINQCIDATFQGKKFVQYQYFFFFQNAISALKIPPFITNNITRFMKEFFYLFKCCYRILHISKLLKDQDIES